MPRVTIWIRASDYPTWKKIVRAKDAPQVLTTAISNWRLLNEFLSKKKPIVTVDTLDGIDIKDV